MKPVLAILMLTSLTACAAQRMAYEPGDTFIVGVSVVDTRDGAIAPESTIVIRGDEIVAIEPTARVRPPPNATIIQSSGFAIPGLWDMHIHALSDPDDAIDRIFPLLITNGVTGVRDMGSLVPGITETRRRMGQSPEIPAPRLYVSGPLLDGVRLPWYGDLPLILRTPADVERELPRLAEAGIDFFKVYDQVPRPAYEAIIAWGAAHGRPVAGHAPNEIGMLGAALAGQRTIEHLSLGTLRECVDDPRAWFNRWISAKFQEGYAAYYQVTLEFAGALDQATCQRAFEAMARQSVYFTPTLDMELNDRSRIDVGALDSLPAIGRAACATLLTAIDQADPALRERAFATYNETLTRMRSAGVTVLAGTDSPNNCLVPGASLHWELERLQASGMSPLEVLQAATLHAAAAMHRRDELGRIAPGYRADIVLLEANPLDDVANARRIEGVMSAGRWRDATALAALAAEARAAAAAQ